eukprot:CAMPEP_0169105850 /NCGR_PEP_ID=MMETSP1015-20121227/24016_1 /TAXON_ID=342587 /ORGANISM="Karlodinium micrum, Strain CCMP2283" /LENGTH=203 /DNA_ID=CAMNT_0009167237 /DNA_START=68 /DNA_END=679 /DNA_ORIENTATION=-
MAQGQRQKVTAHRVTGKIADWKGTFGWIDPSMPIAHPDAVKRRGKIYLHIKDVEEEISGLGADVSFFVYTDGSGLGAMNCKPAAGPAIVKPIHKPVVVQAPRPAAFSQATAGASHPHRTAVSNAQLSGEVTTVKGTFGWITPSQSVSHPLFRGKIYVQQSDMNGAVLAEGQQVVFSLYSDGKGLGAQYVRVSASGDESGRSRE